MNFQSWKPYLLTPRVFRTRRRRTRGPVLFMGCGMYMLFAVAYGLGILMLAEVAVCWDLLVLMAFGYAWSGLMAWRGSARLYRRLRPVAGVV